MSESENEAPSGGLKIGDILFMLFRHKWKILFFGTLGVGAAAAIYLLSPPVYESSAKLLVKYVVERSALDGENQIKTSAGSQTNTLINSEVEILTSEDLALSVVDQIGAGRILKVTTGPASREAAALSIVKALSVTGLKDTDIIEVTYRNQDPELATLVLDDLVKLYFDKHLEVHRSTGVFDLVTKEAGQLRQSSEKTEQELKELKAKAGVVSLAESTTAINTELATSRNDLGTAEAALAAQQARVQEIERLLAENSTDDASGSKDATKSSSLQPNPQAVQEYQSLTARLTQLQQSQTELLSRYTAENSLVKVKQTQIAELERQRHELEAKNPSLFASVSVAGGTGVTVVRPDLVSEKARLVELQAKVNILRDRLKEVQAREQLISDFGPKIAELEQRREAEQTNYKYFQGSLEKARVDETLDPSRMPNISTVQKPTAAVRATRDVKKLVIGCIAGGMGVGVGIALLIEMFLDRSVKRRNELESLHVPLLVSIPYFGKGRQLRLQHSNEVSDTRAVEWDGFESKLSTLDARVSVRPFCEAIRDRLMLDFEADGLIHKPKLVAVTGASKGAGASTLAESLATTFSETCEGKVLLVDGQMEPRRFFRMIADFKASDFDYVIFDMPMVSDTNATASLVSLVDKVLLVVEAEKSTREMVRRAYGQLLAAKADVVAILNKTRVAGPGWLLGAGT